MDNSSSDTILIIDDTADNISLLTKLLEKNHFKVAAANNAKDGLKIAEKLQPNLILMDIMMPEIDGYQACVKLKDQSSTQSIPVIFVSAKSSIEDIIKAFQSGGVDYINKPFFEDEIIARINTQIKIQNLNNNLIESRNKALEASQAKSNFLANMSHELRTPMHGILSFARMGINRYENLTPEEHLKYYSTIKISADRLMKQINNLLDLAKLEAGKMEMEFINANFMKVVDQCVKEQEARLQELEIEIKRTSTLKNEIFTFDVTRIAQVITNLLSNAIKFTDKIKVINIDVLLEEQGQHQFVTLSIKNYGANIPEKELAIVFEKFKQSSEQINYADGTGLGLAICKEIIQAHNGKIWLDNHHDHGGGIIASFMIKVA